MAVGFFLGIRCSFTDQSQAKADDFVAAINEALKAQGLPAYTDPREPPDVYVGNKFGRSSLDHHSARCLVDVAELAGAEGFPQLDRIASNPYRVAFLPVDFSHPFETHYSERIGDEKLQIWVGSAPRLLAELRRLAPQLGIPLGSEDLTEELAAKIDDLQRLSPDDDGDLAENERTAWLVLFEGARLAVHHQIALSLAG